MAKFRPYKSCILHTYMCVYIRRPFPKFTFSGHSCLLFAGAEMSRVCLFFFVYCMLAPPPNHTQGYCIRIVRIIGVRGVYAGVGGGEAHTPAPRHLPPPCPAPVSAGGRPVAVTKFPRQRFIITSAGFCACLQSGS